MTKLKRDPSNIVEHEMEITSGIFETSASNTVRQLWNEKDFTDVTLATVDNQQINVHKVILSSNSKFFKNILLRNPHQNPLIYLKGIRHKELEMIIKFIYVGECVVGQGELKDFLNTGKELEINGLLRNNWIETEKGVSEKEKEPLNQHQRNNIETQDINIDDVTSEIVSKSPVERNSVNIPPTGMAKKKKNGKYTCNLCPGKYSHSNHLRRHQLSKHEGVTHVCDKCLDVFTLKGNLNKHKKSVHDGVMYECDQCDKKFTKQKALDVHKKSVHFGVRYECDKCYSKFSSEKALKKHNDKVHDGF